MTAGDLVEFLRGRLAADEINALAIHAPHCDVLLDEEDRSDCTCGYPVRVLRDVEAKRAILTEADAVQRLLRLTGGEPERYRDWVLRHLASVYSDRPDYRQEWKP